MFFDEVFDSELGAESRFGGAAQGRVDENARITPWALFFSRFLTTVLIFFLHLVRLRPWVAFSRAFALLLTQRGAFRYGGKFPSFCEGVGHIFFGFATNSSEFLCHFVKHLP